MSAWRGEVIGNMTVSADWLADHIFRRGLGSDFMQIFRRSTRVHMLGISVDRHPMEDQEYFRTLGVDGTKILIGIYRKTVYNSSTHFDDISFRSDFHRSMFRHMGKLASNSTVD